MSTETTSPHPVAQTMLAYVRMADEARYRPAAPSDGLGNITVPVDELDIRTEARTYADGWREEENGLEYLIGCPDYRDRPAMVFIIEAARNLCGVERERAAQLLRMALDELEATR